MITNNRPTESDHQQSTHRKWSPTIDPQKMITGNRPKLLSCHSTMFKPPGSTRVEAIGKELLRWCPTCKNCKECQSYMGSLSSNQTWNMRNSDQAAIRWEQREVGCCVPVQNVYGKADWQLRSSQGMQDQDGEPTDQDQENGGDQWKPRVIQETHLRGKREVPVQLTDELQSAPNNLSGLLLIIAASL